MAVKQKRSPKSRRQDDPEKPDEQNDAVMKDAETTSEEKPLPTPTTTSASMDLTVHRLRHLDYIPRPIVCARATPPLDDDSVSFVALSRENGSIEVKAPNEKFRTITEIASLKEKIVSVMAWTCGICGVDSSSTNDNKKNDSSAKQVTCRPTLVGGSSDGTLFVVDFESGGLLGTTASGGGGVLALASLCERRAGSCCRGGSGRQCAQLVAAGCEDGSVRIFQVIKPRQHSSTKSKNPAKLELVSVIPSGSGASVLSVAWMKAETKFVLFAGVSDGTIRRFDCEDRQLTASESNLPTAWKSRLRMTVESLGRNTPTRVWTMQVLADCTVISGDSLGHIQFWDGNSGTLQKSFEQNDSNADVLDIAVTSDECKVFASGVDPRVVCIVRTAHENRKWIISQVQRPHTHDVKGITICRQRYNEGESKRTPMPPQGTTFNEVLCTGGIDTKLCTYYVGEFGKRRPTSLYPWPASPTFAQANKARVLIMRREGKIDLYKLEERPTQQPPEDAFAVPEDETLIGSIQLESACNLVCAEISDDGQYLATADALSLFLFRIKYVSEGDRTSMIPEKLSLNAKVRGSVVAMKWLGDDKLVAATSEGSFHFIKMPSKDADSSTKCSQTMIAKQKTTKVQQKKPLFPIHAIAISKDNKWLAGLQSGFDCCHICVFSLEDGNTCQPWWSVPDLEAPVTALRFLDASGGRPTQLAVSCSNYAFYCFDILARQLCPWSETAGVPVSKHLPPELLNRNDFPVRLASNPACPAKVLLGSFGAFAVIDMDQKIPKRCRLAPVDHHVRKWGKRKRSLSGAESTKEGPKNSEAGTEPAILCLRYNSILWLDFIAENEMVIVEQPWLKVISSFPEAMERKIFGS
ncbi:RNA-associated protein 4 homolog [Seminavis robusta]|uniref:RNA-associated protein 4 homolog n=1 Tax=Seminavis robusta TaxID=568900 RepID=A0A9N8D7G1_9STRA|nr:RNA-associated protein 4 homolog [Seminavis robusta]|eukprot:Sro26_g017510.1 RNA-associated protein 4 homolog (864) ;mRNA; f:40243-43092